MHKIVATALLGAMLAAAQTQPSPQPTAAELLQKGIYTQETAGDLDGAVKIYRQIVDSHPAQREIAAQAQYRLGLTLLAEGDANNASQEIQRLGWDFPDYKELIASAKSAGPQELRLAISKMVDGPPNSTIATNEQFDFTYATTVTGTVTQIQMMNPRAWLTVSSPGTLTPQIRVAVSSPGALAAQGWNKDTLKLGDQVTVVGAPARDHSSTLQATSVSANGSVLWLANLEPKDAAAQDLAKKAALEADQYAPFDLTKSVTVSGTIKQVHLVNPISWLIVSINGNQDTPMRVALASPNALYQAGWRPPLPVKSGDQVTVTGAPARDGTSTMQAILISANGAVLWSIHATK
jgi:hypothetical protein